MRVFFTLGVPSGMVKEKCMIQGQPPRGMRTCTRGQGLY